jgi:glutamine synthetase
MTRPPASPYAADDDDSVLRKGWANHMILTPSGQPDIDALVHELEGDGVSLLLGTALDFAGVTRVKGVPVRRLRSFCESGMGASPTWTVFCAENGVATTEAIGVVGDLRLRLDPSEVRVIDDGLAWGPTSYHEQDGSLSPLCARGRLAEIERRSAELGLDPLMGTEIEFTLVAPDGSLLGSAGWAAYGMSAVVERRAFLVDLTETFERARVGTEQIHPEYGTHQFEVSFARILIALVAARHGFGVSLSPLPATGGVGNGAHLHLSLSRDGANLFSAGTRSHRMTDEGGSAIAGTLDLLPELMSLYGGSILSPLRLVPNSWSGAAACWGLENREAAVRFIAGTPGNPHGANIELKVVDPSANPYLAAAAFLGSALSGIDRGLPLPAEVPSNPSGLPDFDKIRLAATQDEQLDRLAGSRFARELFGQDIIDGVVSVRRHEASVFADSTPGQIAEALRLAWS